MHSSHDILQRNFCPKFVYPEMAKSFHIRVAPESKFTGYPAARYLMFLLYRILDTQLRYPALNDKVLPDFIAINYQIQIRIRRHINILMHNDHRS